MFGQLYKRLFSIHEIEESLTLKWALGAVVFGYFLAFNGWIGSSIVTLEAVLSSSHRCWAHFQGCADWYFLQALPYGYSQTTFYMGLFAVLIGVAYFGSQRNWIAAHALLVIPFLWHALVTFLLTEIAIGNYDYYLAAFGLIILFFPHKEFFLKLTLVSFYVLSTIAKLHETWILGTYFSALKLGLPIFPEWSIPLMSNLVIFMEMVAAWFLLSRNMYLQRAVLIFFIAFHLYSGILVEYRYPATVLPMLLIVFGPFYRVQHTPLDKKALVGWVFIILLFVLQLVPKMIPGDEKLTLEGNKYGLYMFEANHQCISSGVYFTEGGVETPFRQAVANARHRCDPYRFWFILNDFCKTRGNIEKIKWTLDHSVNGGPFYRIVDVEDACSIEYKPFTHNEWIKTEKDNPEIKGHALENYYE